MQLCSFASSHYPLRCPQALARSDIFFNLQDNVLLKGPGGSVKLADFGMSMATHITEPDSDVICGEHFCARSWDPAPT